MPGRARGLSVLSGDRYAPPPFAISWAASEFGFDLIWFAVIMLLALEISFTTPPFGLLLFVMKRVAPQGTTTAQISTAALPLIGCALMLVGLVHLVPDLALVLVR